MKRLTSLMLAVFMVVTMVSASLLTVSAAETTSVSLSAPAEVEFTGDAVEDSFQVEANLNLADGLTAIAGYEVKLTWDPACLTLLETVISGEGITDQKPGEGSLTLAAVNATDVLSGRLFYISFAPIAEGNTTVSVEVLSIATSTGLIDAEGSEVAITAAKPVVIYETPEEILKAAYELADGEYLSDKAAEYTLTGVITAITTAYNPQYGNVSAAITVEGLEEYPILCFRMKGEGADVIKTGDTITVKGYIKNYGGTIEFDAGCALLSYVPGKEEVVIYETPADIINAAYELESGKYLSDGYKYTLTGEILSVDTVYNPDYGNVTVTMTVEGKNIQCYRMKGEGADVIKIGDTITVTGAIKNYNGTIEFDTGCTLESYVPGTPEFVIYETPEEILQEAYKLADGAVLSGGHKYELTGVILSIDTAYDEKYGNISVTIQVGNMSEMPIQCFRLAGEGAAELQVGDTITAKGEIKNYHGKIEFNTCELLNVVKKPSFAFGDVDGNGKPAMADYFKLKSYLLGKNDSFDDGMLERSDIDGNGKVNKQDYFKLKSFLLGKWDPNA